MTDIYKYTYLCRSSIDCVIKSQCYFIYTIYSVKNSWKFWDKFYGMFAPLYSCTIAAPSTINFINYNGYFPCSPLAASLASDHIPWKCGIWKHEDYHINIHSILTSNVFLVISIHIQSCGSDFWKYLLLFSPSNSPKLTGLFTFAQSAHIPQVHSIFGKIL